MEDASRESCFGLEYSVEAGPWGGPGGGGGGGDGVRVAGYEIPVRHYHTINEDGTALSNRILSLVSRTLPSVRL